MNTQNYFKHPSPLKTLDEWRTVFGGSDRMMCPISQAIAEHGEYALAAMTRGKASKQGRSNIRRLCRYNGWRDCFTYSAPAINVRCARIFVCVERVVERRKTDRRKFPN